MPTDTVTDASTDADAVVYYSVRYLDDLGWDGICREGSFGAVAAHSIEEAAAAARAANPDVEVYSIVRTWWTEKIFQEVRQATSEKRKTRRATRVTHGESGTPEPLWENSNGRVTCVAHGGASLRAAIEAHPRRARHDTSVSTFWKLDQPHGEHGCEVCG